MAYDEVLLGSYYLANNEANLSIYPYFNYTIDGDFPTNKIKEEISFFGSRPNFVKDGNGYKLIISSNSLIMVTSYGNKKVIPSTELPLLVGGTDYKILTINKDTGIISTSIIREISKDEELIASYYLSSNSYPNMLSCKFEYEIDGYPFNLKANIFSFWGEKPNFVKNENGWSLQIEQNKTVISFGNKYKLIPNTDLQLLINSLNAMIVINTDTGIISTRAQGEIKYNEIFLGSYYLPNVNSDLTIQPLFEYKINNIDGGIRTTKISFFGSRPNFIKNENGWNLVINSGECGIIIDNKEYKLIPQTNLQLSIGNVSLLIIDKNTGIISTRVYSSPLSSNEEIIGGYFLLNANSELNIQPSFEYKINGYPFGINTDEQEEDFEPIIPNNIFISNDILMPIYKRSLYKLLNIKDTNIIATTIINGKLKSYEVGEPLNLEYENVGDSIKLTFEQLKEQNKNIFKNVKVYKTDIALKSGATPKILMIGDSITHGNLNAQSSPIVKMNELLPSWYNITPSMIGTFAPRGVTGEGRGFFSFEAMVGIENYPYGEQTYGFISYGQTLYDAGITPVTTQFQNPFTFPATESELLNHPDWCFTNKLNYPDEPDGLSYEDADVTQKANYHFFIFNFEKYLELWRNSVDYNDGAYTPDIITIALGTNDWQPGGIIDSERIAFAMRIIYNQIRNILPNVKIGIITSQAIAITLQSFWENEIYKTILKLQKLIKEFNDNGDNNIYEIPLYAHGSRWLAFDGNTASQSSDLNSENNIQQQTIDNNVHLLDGVNSDGYWQYMNALITALVNLI